VNLFRHFDIMKINVEAHGFQFYAAHSRSDKPHKVCRLYPSTEHMKNFVRSYIGSHKVCCKDTCFKFVAGPLSTMRIDQAFMHTRHRKKEVKYADVHTYAVAAKHQNQSYGVEFGFCYDELYELQGMA
jgi:hypothetical protein